MTRRVNFSPQQRVDQPDAQAISAFAAMDARRYARVLFMGTADVASDTGRVIRGFKVVAEDDGVSPRIIVKLNNGPNDLSAFMGAQSQGAGLTDWGQLGGDQDGLGNLEGSAQNLLDFTGAPTQSYEVKIRTTFVPGQLDNRAFWNPAANVEFTKPTNTRLLPQWEIAFENHSDPEWVLLAEVDWQGAVVNTVDITDLRKFPIEGQPVNTTVIAEQWSHALQSDGDTLGVGDFDRNEDRGDSGAAINALWESNRALARQLQDIKGGRESDLRFDWFSRIFAAPARLAADPASKLTRTMRTMDVVTFTCSDGTTDQGDFNGLSAVYDCFKYIEDNGANLPQSIDIVVKSRALGNPSDFTWAQQVTITDKSIRLRAVGGASTAFNTPDVWNTPHNPTVILTAGMTTGGTAAIVMTGRGSLHLENIFFLGVPDRTMGIISCAITCAFSCKSAVLSGFPGDDAEPVLRVPSQHLDIEHSFISGTSYIGGRAVPDSATLFGPPGGIHREDTQWQGGRITDSALLGLVRFKHSDFVLAGGAESDPWKFANSLVCDNVKFLESADAQTDFSADGQVDMRGCRNMDFRNCQYTYHGDQTCVRISRVIVSSLALFRESENIHFDNCQWKLDRHAEHDGFVSGAGGVSGAEGTGWAVYAGNENNVETINFQEVVSGVYFDSCDFQAGVAVDGTDPASVPVETPCDAGYIRIFNCRDVWIDKCKFRAWGQPGAVLQNLDIQSLVALQGSAGGLAVGGARGMHCTNSTFQPAFGAPGSADDFSTLARFICLSVLGVIESWADDNDFNAGSSVTVAGASIKTPPLPSALVLTNTIEARACGNTFNAWRDAATPLLNTCVGLLGVNSRLTIHGNEFNDCGGANIVCEVNELHSFLDVSRNDFNVGSDGALFDSCLDTDTFATGGTVLRCIGNRWNYTGADHPAVRMVEDEGAIVSNWFTDGEIKHGSGAGAKVLLLGFEVVGATDLNVVGAYTGP